MAKKGAETAVVRRMVKSDEDDFYGDVGSTESGVAVLDRCIVWPRASTSDDSRGVTTVEGLHIFVPPDELEWDPSLPVEERELRPQDKVTVRGEDWMLDGAVGDWRRPRGKRVGYLFEVVRWSG